MATYVFSDVHGHARTLERLLDRISPAAEDHIFMLGDMIDRGPDPLAVLRICRGLADGGATVLMGNHEDLMLAYYDDPGDLANFANWAINGGGTTKEQLETLSKEELLDLLDWVRALPLSAYTRVSGQLYLFAHAGIQPIIPVPAMAIDATARDEDRIHAIVDKQSPEALMWVRQEFWGCPTGLVDKEGKGIIVVAGHTPTPYLDIMADRPDRSGADKDGLGRMVRVGACAETGNVADRWDIDSGCAGGHGFGKLLFLRLDDGSEFYEPVGKDE
ncbi:metallophosphoesterase family protein [uncultured Olegusella sp.]|uniref:metallophosphoesterase family protein n=1 Tax=uncultured Olegusella sp. TaxID=1979846 RepID=UPI00262443B7|nr:metallophosphoesterase family protein [uncultured Olegusella sp.]